MPSSPNYKRNYRQEAASEGSQRKADRAARNKARRVVTKALGPAAVAGKDVDHRKELSQGGDAFDLKNLQPLDPHKNRSYKRNSDGSIK